MEFHSLDFHLKQNKITSVCSAFVEADVSQVSPSPVRASTFVRSCIIHMSCRMDTYVVMFYQTQGIENLATLFSNESIEVHKPGFYRLMIR